MSTKVYRMSVLRGRYWLTCPLARILGYSGSYGRWFLVGFCSVGARSSRLHMGVAEAPVCNCPKHVTKHDPLETQDR
jgi:hypothetical protein